MSSYDGFVVEKGTTTKTIRKQNNSAPRWMVSLHRQSGIWRKTSFTKVYPGNDEDRQQQMKKNVNSTIEAARCNARREGTEG